MGQELVLNIMRLANDDRFPGILSVQGMEEIDWTHLARSIQQPKKDHELLAHQQAQVLEIDLSPIQPTLVPCNCTFQVFNYEKTWNFVRRFDFIHARTPVGGIKNLDTLLAQAFKHLLPGGYIEFSPFCPPTSDDIP